MPGLALGVTILEQIPGALIGTLNGPEELRNWVSRLTSLGCLGGATGLSFTGVHSAQDGFLAVNLE